MAQEILKRFDSTSIPLYRSFSTLTEADTAHNDSSDAVNLNDAPPKQDDGCGC